MTSHWRHPLWLTIFAVSSAFLTPWRAMSAPAADQQWDDGFYVLGGADTVSLAALAVGPSGDLFVGGAFTRLAGNVVPGNIARWDGVTWSALGTGLNGSVGAIAVKGTQLFVGGTFTSAGAQAITNLARWDGTNWWPVGGGVAGGGVTTLMVVGEELYVGGTFTNAGGVTVGNVAKWDGQAWSEMRGGVEATGAGVNAMLMRNGELVVAGRFTGAGGTAATNVARWDGAAWHALGAGLAITAFSLTQDADGNLYAGGGTTSAGHYIAKWDEKSWSTMPSGDPGFHSPVRTLFVWEGVLYAGGLGLSVPVATPGLSRWTGTSWVSVAAPFYGSVNGPAVGPDGFYVAGRLDYVMSPTPTGTRARLGVAKYNGSEWAVLGAGLSLEGSPYSSFVRSLVVAGDSVIAGGHLHGEVEFFAEHAVARWNGRIWSPLAPRGYNIAWGRCDRCAVLALGYDDGIVYTGSSFSQFAARWDDTWSPIPAPGAVRAIAMKGSVPYLGGDFGVLGWDGQSQTNFTLGRGIHGAVFALAFHGDDLIAGGSFVAAGEGAASNIARWDGTNWWPLNTGVDSSVHALASRGHELIVGGSFTNAGAVLANCIAVWDRTNWSSLGTGFTAGRARDAFLAVVPTSVNALAVTADGLIYAAGNFTKADQGQADYIAYWVGDGWRPLGSGLNQIPYALALKDEGLFVGGDFTRAGGKPSSRIALWHGNASMRAPRLHVERSGPDVLLSWQASTATYVLEGATQLSELESWTPLPYGLQGDRYFSTNPPSPGRQHYYFRLRK